MRCTFWAATAVLLASFLNAVPSDAALHPANSMCSLKEADLTGSGLEVPQERTVRGNSSGERADARVIREWRAMAARCRSLAQWQNDGAREALLQLAAEYEDRADRAEHRLQS